MRAALLAELKAPVRGRGGRPARPDARAASSCAPGATPFCSTDCVNQRGELGKVPPTILGHASMGGCRRGGRRRRDAHRASATASSCPARPSAASASTARSGRPDQCSETFDRGGIWLHVADRTDGEPVTAAGNVGGYAEVMNVTANQVFPLRDRPARRVAAPARLRDHVRASAPCSTSREVQAGASRRRRRRRPPGPVDGAGREAGRSGADHRGRPDRRAPRAARAASAPPTSSTRPTATRSSRCAPLTGGRGADYVLEAAGPTGGAGAGGADVAARRHGRAHERRAPSDATVTLPQVALAAAEPARPERPERQRAGCGTTCRASSG